jgi:hypothetical protein
VATFDQLSEEQRAIVELVLRRGKDYEQLSEMLDLPEPRVRELAREALFDLAPLSGRGVDEDWRGQLADYVLGQQSGPEATATRGHLRRSEAARTWARSLLDSLEQLYDNGSMPAIPEGERGGRSRRPEAPGASGPLAATDVTRRRRALALGGTLAALVLLAVLVWPVGLVTGGDDDGSDDAAAAGPACVPGNASRAPAGVVVFRGQRKLRALEIQASGLQPSTRRCVYQVWLYNTPDKALSLGVQVVDANGALPKSAGVLPPDFAKYRYVDISREPLNGPVAHSGDSVLRGAIPRNLAQVQGTKITRLGQAVLKPPPS